MARPALFLDRDGVVNVDKAYVYRREDFDFMPGVKALCQAARARGYAIVIVTNQSGIGRGYYSEADFHSLMTWVASELGGVDATYFCPDLPDAKDSRRKPSPAMILEAARDLDLDLSRSLLVGDKDSDIAAGTAAGVGLNLLLGRDIQSLSEAERSLR